MEVPILYSVIYLFGGSLVHFSSKCPLLRSSTFCTVSFIWKILKYILEVLLLECPFLMEVMCYLVSTSSFLSCRRWQLISVKRCGHCHECGRAECDCCHGDCTGSHPVLEEEEICPELYTQR